jgi:L-fuconolactonase
MMNHVIDTHVHIWDLEKAEYKWLENDTTLLNRTYRLGELSPHIGKANVTQGVLVQAANNFADTDMMLNAAAATAWITGIVGWLPLTDPLATEKALTEKYLKNPYFKGCRHLIHNEPDPYWLLQEPVIESLRLLASYGLTYDVVGVNNAHLQTAIRLAEKAPELKMVLDHLNQPPISSGEKFGEWGALMQTAAQHKNICAKISGLGTTAGAGDWTKETLKPYVLYAIELFGTNRCFCGGDWPVSLLAGPFEKAWLAYQQIFAEALTAAEQEKILSSNARSFYNLPSPS